MDDNGNTGESQSGKRSTTATTKGGSPGKKKSKKASVEPILQGGSTGPSGSVLINLGGSGECGWRALSWSIAVANNPKSSDQAVDSIETLATTLKIQMDQMK